MPSSSDVSDMSLHTLIVIIITLLSLLCEVVYGTLFQLSSGILVPYPGIFSFIVASLLIDVLCFAI